MSPSTKFTHTVSATLVGIGAVAIVAAFCVGLAGWPPARAHAETAPDTLGVTEGTAVSLVEAPSVSEKFEGSAETSPAALTMTNGHLSISSVGALMTTAAKSRLVKPAPLAYMGQPTGKGWRRCRVSWYGPGFYGHTMAGGGRLRRTSMIVAHRSLPFGTRVQISYRGRVVTAVVRDRGPFVSGRTFDLGPGTAKSLHFSGVGRIRYRVLGG